MMRVPRNPLGRLVRSKVGRDLRARRVDCLAPLAWQRVAKRDKVGRDLRARRVDCLAPLAWQRVAERGRARCHPRRVAKSGLARSRETRWPRNGTKENESVED